MRLSPVEHKLPTAWLSCIITKHCCIYLMLLTLIPRSEGTSVMTLCGLAVLYDKKERTIWCRLP